MLMKRDAVRIIRIVNQHKIIQYHLSAGTLVLIAGCIPGIIIARIDAEYYDVLTSGKVHRVHRNDMVENDDNDL